MKIFIDLFGKERIKRLNGHFGFGQADGPWQLIISVSAMDVSFIPPRFFPRLTEACLN